VAKPRRSKAYRAALSEAIRRAQRLLDDCGIEEVPVNLLLLAERQGIRRIREMDTRLDGQLLELDSGGYEVILSKNAPLSRKRFTLAHEIAHTLLGKGDGLACGGGITEELCNAAAAEMLVPTRFLKKFLEPANITIRSFVDVSQNFKCSLDVAGWRLLNLGLIQGALLIWRTKLEAGVEVFELASIPHTWGWELPITPGVVALPGGSLWKALTRNGPSAIEISDFCPGQVLRGEHMKMRRTALIFIKAPGEGEAHEEPSHTLSGRRESRATPGLFDFEEGRRG